MIVAVWGEKAKYQLYKGCYITADVTLGKGGAIQASITTHWKSRGLLTERVS